VRLQTDKWPENGPAWAQKPLRSGPKRRIGLTEQHQHISSRFKQTIPKPLFLLITFGIFVDQEIHS
jgi:hypothetical protein